MSTTAMFVDWETTLTIAGTVPAAVAAALERLAQRTVPVIAISNAEASAAAALAESLAAANASVTSVRHAGEEAAPANRLPRPGLLLQAAADLKLDLFSSWVVSSSVDLIEAGAQAGCVGAVLLGDCPDPSPSCLIHQVRARDLADAPRVMIPPGGGCWHDPR